MANKGFDGKVFEDYSQLRKILPAQNGGVVIIQEEKGLKVKGAVMTAEDGNYKRDLGLAESGVKALYPEKETKVKIILVWILPFTAKIVNNLLRFICKGLTPLDNLSNGVDFF